MSNTGIKKILFTVISVLIVATVVAVSFAIWDTKTADNSFKATGGDRINVTVAGAETFNALLVPDGVIPSAASASTKNALYIYADFTPKIGNDDTKNAKLRWKFETFKLDGTDLLKADKLALKDESVLDCWVSTVATLDKPSNVIESGKGELVSGTKYYFVVKFKMFKYKEYTDATNKVYKFYSNGSYSIGDANQGTYDNNFLTGLGITINSALTPYENAPYQSEFIDTAKYSGYSGKAIQTAIKIYAEQSAN